MYHIEKHKMKYNFYVMKATAMNNKTV